MMKKYLIYISILFSPFSIILAQNETTINIVDSTIEQRTFSSINAYKFFEGISLGQIPIKVSFDSIYFSPDSKEVFISGKTFNQITNETLKSATVAIGKIDSSKKGFTIVPNVSTTSDSLGSFKLRGKIKPKDKLVFLEVGFFVKIYNIDLLLKKLK
jgi:hypothetical protein